MLIIKIKGKAYAVDTDGFLLNPQDWDDNFAEATADSVRIGGGLTSRHWDVIRFIREFYAQKGTCPLVHETCRSTHLDLKELETLFPTGYLRGACKVAGVTYREGYVSHSYNLASEFLSPGSSKTYEVDVRGFLVRPEQWDEQFAVFKAHEMKMPGPLADAQWRVLRFLRDYYQRTKGVPTIYETCREYGIELDELEKMFPDGYHRGAVKLAGLRVR